MRELVNKQLRKKVKMWSERKNEAMKINHRRLKLDNDEISQLDSSRLSGSYSLYVGQMKEKLIELSKLKMELSKPSEYFNNISSVTLTS